MEEQQQQPKVEWNSPLEKLLCDEAEKCSGLAWLHTKAEAFFSRCNNYLQIPVIILSTITGATSIGSQSLFGGSEDASVGIGCVSLLVGILGTINSYFAFAKRSEGHRLGMVQYSQIYKTIHIEMSLPRGQRMPPKILLKLIKEDLKRLSETLPQVPDNIIKMYKREIIPHTTDIEHPEITNGIHAVHPYSEIATTPELSIKKPDIKITIK